MNNEVICQYKEWSLKNICSNGRHTYISSFALAWEVSAVSSDGFGDSISMLNSTCKTTFWSKVFYGNLRKHKWRWIHTEGMLSNCESFSWSMIQFTAASRLELPEDEYKSKIWVIQDMKFGLFWSGLYIPEWCRAQAARAIENPISSSSLSNPRLTSTAAFSVLP